MHLTSTLAIAAAVIAMALHSSHAFAEVVSIQVIDQDGQPVKDAVLMGPTGYHSTELSQTRNQPAAIMDQIDKAFVPEVLTIEQGRHVNFPNSDNIRHHVYSFSKPKMFELKLYAGQPEHPIPFEHSGIVVLGCNIHDRMTGFIIVSDTKNWAQTDNSGMAQLDLPIGSPIRIWHPRKTSGFNDVEERALPEKEQSETRSLQLDLKAIPKPAPTRGFGSDRFKTNGR